MDRPERFCCRCGGALASKSEGGRDRPWCPACGYILFGRFSVGAGGLLCHEGRVLLVQRARDPGMGRWTLPGGYAEEDEPPDAALAREVLEETGLRVSVTGIIAIRHAQGAENQNAYYVFGMKLDGPISDLRECGDGDEVARAVLADPAQLDALGEIGMISRWAIDRHGPDDAAMFRVADRAMPAPPPSHRWQVLFAVRGSSG